MKFGFEMTQEQEHPVKDASAKANFFFLHRNLRVRFFLSLLFFTLGGFFLFFGRKRSESESKRSKAPFA